MGFLTTRRFVKQGVTGQEPAVLGFVGVCLLFTGAAVYGIFDLRSFGGSRSQITVSAWCIAFTCLSAFWGFLIALWIALARGNRLPQAAEWIIFYTSLIIAVVPMFVTGPLVKLYGAAHGYRFCYSTHQMPSELTFAAAGHACPPPPPPDPTLAHPRPR